MSLKFQFWKSLCAFIARIIAVIKTKENVVSCPEADRERMELKEEEERKERKDRSTHTRSTAVNNRVLYLTFN